MFSGIVQKNLISENKSGFILADFCVNKLSTITYALQMENKLQFTLIKKGRKKICSVEKLLTFLILNFSSTAFQFESC